MDEFKEPMVVVVPPAVQSCPDLTFMTRKRPALFPENRARGLTIKVVKTYHFRVGSEPTRSDHEREERSLRTPFRPDRSRGPRHAGGGLAGDRHRAGNFVVVRADRVRGARRKARRGDAELRSGHGVPFSHHGVGSAAAVRRRVQRVGPRLASDRRRVERRGARRRDLRRPHRAQPLREHGRVGQPVGRHRVGMAGLLPHPADLSHAPPRPTLQDDAMDPPPRPEPRRRSGKG
jgi:hypothetical protein